MRVGVVGAGTMGIGIAHAAAINGFEVIVVEPDALQIERAKSRIEEVISSGVTRGKMSQANAEAARSLLSYVATPGDLPMGLDWIIEAVPEIVELKHSVLKAIQERRPGHIGSNTSALSISELAGALGEPASFIGLHFFNPVWSMKLLEVVVGRSTSPETIEAARELARGLAKEPIVVKDAPGFASSRLGILLGMEAIRMVEQGIASAEDIDKAMVLGYGHPMGPLRLSDLVGLDVRLDIARNLAKEYGDRFTPPQLLVDLVDGGKLGKKSGQGFYKWD